jgi:anaerobic magnesium-protoporphyrin IX monomethyl ester cyclase
MESGSGKETPSPARPRRPRPAKNLSPAVRYEMRVLLVLPRRKNRLFEDVRLPPLGIAYLAGVLRQAGHTARLIDANLESDQDLALRSRLAAFAPDLVGFSVASPLRRAALRLARLVKEKDAGIKVVFGGSHPTIFPAETAAEPDVDFAVRGEGEDTILELMEVLAGRLNPAMVPGLAFREDGRIRLTPPRPPIQPLDRLPFPAYDLLPIGRYQGVRARASAFMEMFTSRGCPYHCAFCDAHIVMGRAYRAHSPGRTRAEIQHLVGAFGVREIMFKDSEFTHDRGRIEALCDLLIEDGSPVRWTCNGRVGRVDAPLLRKMRRAGCEMISFGVESGDQAVLIALNKGTTPDRIRETFRAARAAGIKTQANFLIGHPEEDARAVLRSIRLAAELRPDLLQFNYLFPYPGTDLYRRALEKGWLPDDFDPSAGLDFQPALKTPLIDRRDLAWLLRYAFRSVYLRPGAIARRLFSLSPTVWSYNIRGGLKLIRLRRRG